MNGKCILHQDNSILVLIARVLTPQNPGEYIIMICEKCNKRLLPLIPLEYASGVTALLEYCPSCKSVFYDC